MFENIDQALAAVRSARPSEAEYREACEYLVDNREQLTQRVFINLPGGLAGNTDPAWGKVKEGSEERCGCGNERVIIPLNPRSDFVPSDSGQIVVAAESPVYLKPVGGDKSSAYIKVEIEHGALTFLEDPFAPFVLTPDFLSTRGYKLAELTALLPEQPKPPVFMRKFGGVPTPIFAINAVDAGAGTAAITPDAAVEAFDPNLEEGHSCNTRALG